MNKPTIYADHAATTPLSPAARQAMFPYLDTLFGNPSTKYSLARDPRKAIASARETIASAIGASPEEIYFTSGGTEADNWALKGIAYASPLPKRFVTSSIEHHAVLRSCEALMRMGHSVHYLPVDENGLVSCADLEPALMQDTALVSIMLANNEIGTIEPIEELSRIAHEHGAIFHTDAVQAVGHIVIDVKQLGVDMLSSSSHKFNGPKGIGFLFVRNGVHLLPLMDGGAQEHGIRAGTENVASIVGMATALQEHRNRLDAEIAYISSLQERFLTKLKDTSLDYHINGAEKRIPGNISLSIRDANGEMLMHRLDLMGISVATGSACDSQEEVQSHVIHAIHVPQSYAQGTIRLSFGMDNTEEQIDRIVACIERIISSIAR